MRHGLETLLRGLGRAGFAGCLAATLLAVPPPAAAEDTIGAQQIRIQVRLVTVERAQIAALGFEPGGSFRTAARELSDVPMLSALFEDDASLLASPSRITTSGQTAKFAIGDDEGTLADVAIRLDVVPTLGEGRSVELATQLNVDRLPGPDPFAPRSARNVSQLENGGSLLIGGFFGRQPEGLRSVPFVGRLFGGPTPDAGDMIVVVTPWLVAPDGGGRAVGPRGVPQVFKHRPTPDVAAPPQVPTQVETPRGAPAYPHGPSDRVRP